MPKGNEIAQAYISIIPEMSGIQGKIAKELNADVVGQGEGKKLGGGMLSGLGSAAGQIASVVSKAAIAGTAAAATGIAALTKSAMDGYSKFEQLAGGAEQIFSNVDYDRIISDAQGAYKTMGISANDYLESINQVGAAFKATMGDELGYETAKRGMQAISDYASGTGRDLNELNEKYAMITRSTSSYQSIADQFSGILPATSADFLEQAQSAGLLSDEYKKLTDVPIAEYQQAVTGMLERGVDSLNLTGNTAREATETISGSIDMAKAAWSNFVVELGRNDADIESRTSELVDSVIAVAENVIPRVATIISRLAQKLPSLIQKLGPVLANAVTSILDSISNGGFSRALQAIQPAIDAVSTTIHNLADRFSALAPRANHVAETFGGILADAVNMAAGIFAAFAPVIADIAEAVLPMLDKALDVVSDAFDAAMPYVQGLADFLSGALSEAVQFISDGFQALSDLLGPIFEGIGSAFDSTTQWVTDNLGWLGKMFGITESDASDSAERMNRNVSNSTDNMRSNVSGSMSSMADDVSSQADRAASTSESESDRIESAWNRTYDMELDAYADTSSAESDLSWLYDSWNGTTITFYTESFGGGGGGGAFAAGAIIQKHADGFIVDKPGRGVDITRHIAGEAGGEAIIPLTNRQYVAPFAKVVADFVNDRSAGVVVTGNTFNVRKDSDIRAIAMAINQQAERERGARL